MANICVLDLQSLAQFHTFLRVVINTINAAYTAANIVVSRKFSVRHATVTPICVLQVADEDAAFIERTRLGVTLILGISTFLTTTLRGVYDSLFYGIIGLAPASLVLFFFC